jgi:hypothetical protein
MTPSWSVAAQHAVAHAVVLHHQSLGLLRVRPQAQEAFVPESLGHRRIDPLDPVPLAFEPDRLRLLEETGEE